MPLPESHNSADARGDAEGGSALLVATARPRVAWTALILNLACIAPFVLWAARTDLLFHHYTGPPRYLITAFVTAIIGMALGVAFLVAAKVTAKQPGVARQLLILSFAPALIIAVAGAFGLPEALAQLRRERVRALAADESSVPQLIRALSDRDWYVRDDAVLQLGRLGPRAHAAVPALIRVLQNTRHLRSNDPGSAIRDQAVYALGAIGPDAASAVPELLMVIRACEEPKTSSGSENGSVVHALPPGRIDHRYAICTKAGDALARIGPACSASVAGLLGDANPNVRLHAVDILARLSPRDPNAASALRRTLSDEDARVRFAAERALNPTPAPRIR